MDNFYMDKEDPKDFLSKIKGKIRDINVTKDSSKPTLIDALYNDRKNRYDNRDNFER